MLSGAPVSPGNGKSPDPIKGELTAGSEIMAVNKTSALLRNKKVILLLE